MPKHLGPSAIANGLLAALRPDVLTALLPKFEVVELRVRQILTRPDTPIEAVYFLESGWVSVFASLDDGAQAEVGLYGREGMGPLSPVHGVDTSFVETCVQGAGVARRMGLAAFKTELNLQPSLKELLLKYSEAIHAQTVQAAACNSRHPLKQRLARWLLMAHDRIDGDDIFVTQDFLALKLSVFRPSVSLAARGLEQASIIRNHPGKITILERHRLEDAACCCYRAVTARFAELLG